MKKYLIVDTFNGVGYSDSSAKIVEFASIDDAREYALAMAREFKDEDSPLEILEDRIIYGVNGDDDIEYDAEYPLDRYEDHGAVHFVKLDAGTVAVLIEPTINEFTQLEDTDIDEVVSRLSESEESDEGEDLEGTCHHLDDSVEIYIRIENL